jgi:hypothetical protein
VLRFQVLSCTVLLNNLSALTRSLTQKELGKTRNNGDENAFSRALLEEITARYSSVVGANELWDQRWSLPVVRRAG